MNKCNSVFHWNVYIPTKAMEKLERDFYEKLYTYRYYCYHKCNNPNFRETVEYKNNLKQVNLAYEKIKNLAGVEKNEFGEYDYPKVSYKLREVINNPGNKILFACIADEGMNNKMPVEDILATIPLAYNGNIITNVDFEHKPIVSIETMVKNVIENYRKNYDSLSDFEAEEFCHKTIQWLDKFPVNSICEIEYLRFLSEEVIRDTCESFKEMYVLSKQN